LTIHSFTDLRKIKHFVNYLHAPVIPRQPKESSGTNFLVKSGNIFQAIAQQKENWTNMPSSNLGTEPHEGLKDVLIEPENPGSHPQQYTRLGSLCTSFLWGNNAVV
jgi:hypothetical protein